MQVASRYVHLFPSTNLQKLLVVIKYYTIEYYLVKLLGKQVMSALLKAHALSRQNYHKKCRDPSNITNNCVNSNHNIVFLASCVSA